MPGRKRWLLALMLTGQVWGQGDPIALNIKGNVKAVPCQVSSDSITKTVDLTAGSPVTASSMYTAGSTTPWVSFDFSIEHCPEGTTGVMIQFNGNADDMHRDDMYRNLGTATPVAIQLQAADGRPLGDGQVLTSEIVAQRYTWNLRARLYSEQGQVSPGTIDSVVTVSLSYQ
ncbi:type 1 fimbrial protein [Citrobacter sp. CK184]|uniref:fimbrial protein n=1 Tax=unclassified Citrobacter TaxID=2644389 RepID=UPI0025781006|nr:MULTISPECIES: fimbrial protein [unclassified Citrobacter]MDM3030731.1 type 1 fimbrial protein [Citrobacter sp. CK185]MDM3045957.1 type 1 fimbrial protein [Citrobacter sp. CK184]